MNIGNLKANDDGIHIGRIVTMTFTATIALREFHSNNERAPTFDIMALSADRRSWVKVGALWEFHSNETGETFLSGRIDDPSLDKALDIALFRQEDGSYNIAWRRPQRKAAMPVSNGSDDSLPPLPPMGDGAGDPGAGAPSGGSAGGDGLGESTAPASSSKSRSAEKAKAHEPA